MGEKMWAVIVDEDQPLKLGEAEKPVCGDNDVLIEVITAGLNRADLVQRRGLYPPPPGASQIMGLECAGTVVAHGAAVTDCAIGDRVCGLLAGGGIRGGQGFGATNEMGTKIDEGG